MIVLYDVSREGRCTALACVVCCYMLLVGNASQSIDIARQFRLTNQSVTASSYSVTAIASVRWSELKKPAGWFPSEITVYQTSQQCFSLTQPASFS